MTGSGTLLDPYIITTVEELQQMQEAPTACYKLGNNIDASDTINWNDGAGFIPIRTGMSRAPTSDGTFSGYWTQYPDDSRPYYEKVDDAGADGDATYISTEAGPASGMFGFSPFAVPVGASGISLQVILVTKVWLYPAADPAAFWGTINGRVTVGGTNYVSSSAASKDGYDTTYMTHSFLFSQNPKTGSAWTVDQINGVGTNHLEYAGLYTTVDGVHNGRYYTTRVFFRVSYTGTLGASDFDGDEYTISDLFVQPTEHYPDGTDILNIGGLFEDSSGRTVHDVTLDNLQIINDYSNNSMIIGGIAGFAYGIGVSTTFTNCHVIGTIDGATIYGIGGILGDANISSPGVATFTDCTVNVDITSVKASYFGGLVGHVWGKTVIDNCTTTGSITTTIATSFDNYAGGLAGWLRPVYVASSITDSSSTMSIADGIYIDYVGGLIGSLTGTSGGGGQNTLTNCYYSGDVSGHQYVGGIAGTIYDTNISKCYSTGTVSGSGYAGGFAGDIEDASDCYSRSTVYGGSHAGGFAAYFYGIIDNCYSTGAVSGSGAVGGLIGENSSGTITDSFWDTETSGTETSDGGVGHITTWMKTQANFEAAGWDFTTPIWYTDLILNDGYPQFIGTSSQDLKDIDSRLKLAVIDYTSDNLITRFKLGILTYGPNILNSRFKIFNYSFNPDILKTRFKLWMHSDNINTRFKLEKKPLTTYKENNMLEVTKGDYGYIITDTLLNYDDTIFDLTGYTVDFHVWNPADPDNPMVSRSATIISPSLGTVSYAVQWNDFLISGIFRQKWLAKKAGEEQSFPFDGNPIKVLESE